MRIVKWHIRQKKCNKFSAIFTNSYIDKLIYFINADRKRDYKDGKTAFTHLLRAVRERGA